MPEIPLKISRAIIRKKARELRHNNFMGQGESVLCNFAERAPMPKGIENPIRHYSRLFVIARHYSRLFAVFGRYSGFITG